MGPCGQRHEGKRCPSRAVFVLFCFFDKLREGRHSNVNEVSSQHPITLRFLGGSLSPPLSSFQIDSLHEPDTSLTRNQVPVRGV